MTVRPVMPNLSFLLPPPGAYSTIKGGDEVYTSVLTPDARCPYPYPGVYCGEPSTTLITKTKTKTAETTKAPSATTCGYPGTDLFC